jgi:hypothetical protein
MWKGEWMTLKEWQLFPKPVRKVLTSIAIKRREEKGREWEDYILYLAVLPYLVANALGLDLTPTNDAEATVLEIVQVNCFAHATWMDYLAHWKLSQLEVIP